MKVQIDKMAGLATSELIQLEGFDPSDDMALKICLDMSEVVYSASYEGRGACLWGLIPPSLLSDKAYLWLFATDVANDHTFLLARHSRMIVEEMLEEHPILIGHCHLEDTRAHRWLKWLGAEFGFPQNKGIPFTIRKKNG